MSLIGSNKFEILRCFRTIEPANFKVEMQVFTLDWQVSSCIIVVLGFVTVLGAPVVVLVAVYI